MRLRPSTTSPHQLGPFRLPRDPATDGTSPAGFETVGLDGDPYPRVVLGRQVESGARDFSRAGRPARFRSGIVRVQARNLGAELRPACSPGTIRRNVLYPGNGLGPTVFDPVTNTFVESRSKPSDLQPPQDEYLVSSLALGLSDPLATVVSGTIKPDPGLQDTYRTSTIQAQPSSGRPVIAPQIPSYGSRVPLLRPRGLVTVAGTSS